MKNIKYVFLFLGGLGLLFILFIAVQVLHSFPGIWRLPLKELGGFGLFCCILFFLLILWGFVKILSQQVAKKYILQGGIVGFSFLLLYTLLYAYIPLSADDQSPLELRENNNSYEERDKILYTQFQEIEETLNTFKTQSEKEVYVQEILWKVAQEYYDDTVDVYTKKYVRTGFFYNSKQFLKYKKQSFSQVASHLNDESPILYGRDVSLERQMLSWLLKRENFYDSYGGDLEKFKDEKNQLLDLLYSAKLK